MTGLNFRASTARRHTHPEATGRQFLEREGRQRIPFFATWMSRDAVYLAPYDTQRSIVDQWRRWLAKEGSRFQYRAGQKIDDWYFGISARPKNRSELTEERPSIK